MGRPKKYNPAELEEQWEAYKADCDNHFVISHAFSPKLGEFVSERLNKPITYTIEGFCCFAGLARSALYENYEPDKRFTDIITRIRLECEICVRSRFEDGSIPTQLSSLWMSKYGYSAKTDNNITGAIGVQFVDDLDSADGDVDNANK